MRKSLSTTLGPLAIGLQILFFVGYTHAQEKGLPPIAVPPPATGDDINTPPPVVDPKIVAPAPPAASEQPKPSDERVFCSARSMLDAMAKCREYTAREGGYCEEAGSSTNCRFQAKLVKEVNTLHQDKGKEKSKAK